MQLCVKTHDLNYDVIHVTSDNSPRSFAPTFTNIDNTIIFEKKKGTRRYDPPLELGGIPVNIWKYHYFGTPSLF